MDSELILNADGSLYHLHLHPNDLAEKVIFVGDQARVDKVARHLDRIELTRQHREFRTITGELAGERISILSTGIGPDNIDIVWNELDALLNFDLETRRVKSELSKLKVLRLGTCGGLQAGVEVGSFVHSRYAIGGDALMSYYAPSSKAPAATQALRLTLRQWRQQHFPDQAQPWYVAQGDEDLDERIATHFPQILAGITFTAAGFYGPQGRALGRLPLGFDQLPERLASFEFDGLKLLNFEMETAAILSLGHALGHQAGSLSVILANRAQRRFHPDPSAAIEALITAGLEIMLGW
ncbi:MAG: nucleoside phosphorylase [Bacteroidota bacterium]